MYYYKKVNEANEVEYLEECVHEKARLSLNLAEISESEYRELLKTMLGSDTEDSDEYQRGYEQALLDMAEVGV